MAAFAPGAWPGFVVDNKDPKNAARVIAGVPGIIDKTRYWCHPLNFASEPDGQRGSSLRIPKIGTPIVLVFLYGDPNEGGFYFLGPPGVPKGVPGVPTPIAATSDWSTRESIHSLHEDETFSFYIVSDAAKDLKQAVLIDKRTGTNITLDSAGGTSKKAAGIVIEGETEIRLKSVYGRIVIEAPRVVINGRVVAGGTDTI